MWKNRQESGGMEGALVVLLLACIIIKSGLLAFCLYAARPAENDEKKRSLLPRNQHVPWKIVVGSRCCWIWRSDHPRFCWKEDTTKGCQSSLWNLGVPFETWVMLRYIYFFQIICITPLMFNIDPENRPCHPKRKGSSSNHHFSGSMLNFWGVRRPGWPNLFRDDGLIIPPRPAILN